MNTGRVKLDLNSIEHALINCVGSVHVQKQQETQNFNR